MSDRERRLESAGSTQTMKIDVSSGLVVTLGDAIDQDDE
jgi:hypothetical protein